jgi:cysteine-rich CWC protein
VRLDTTQVREAPSSRAVIVLSSMNPEICESCGREFSCGAQDPHCWCAKLTVGRERLAIVREHFERCLCPDCLRLLAADGPLRQTAD